jgi:hypothetical protein
MAKLADIAGPRVGALEVPYEGVPKLCPAVDPPSREVSSQVCAELARYRGMLLMINISLVTPALWQAR